MKGVGSMTLFGWSSTSRGSFATRHRIHVDDLVDALEERQQPHILFNKAEHRQLSLDLHNFALRTLYSASFVYKE